MIRWLMCHVFGHQPHDYEYEKNSVTTVKYTECARCAKRKSLDGKGWQR